ncbi:MAG: hypothetical protein IKJ36_02300 [Clostridia bacterium]|nr:hypothetical protein [Clostridia bacterium]
MKEKRKINGIKDNNQNYKGNVSEIVKKIMALVLSLGMMITAAEAIRMYNQWRASKNPEVGIENHDELKKVTFEDVKAIVEEYREAVESNDIEKQKSLNIKFAEGDYFSALLGKYKEQIVESLDLDPEKVEVVLARDGTFLVDKEKAKGKVILDHAGQLLDSVKYLDKNGKNPQIPYEIKKMFNDLGTDMSVARYRGISDLERHYSNYEYIEQYEIEDQER